MRPPLTSPAIRPFDRPLPPLARVVARVVATVAAWRERRRTRQALHRLDEHLLKDVGLSQDHRATECGKGFWQD